MRRACVSAEFRAMAAHQTSPVTAWLHALARVAAEARRGDVILGMSNGSFGGFHAALLAELRKERA